MGGGFFAKAWRTAQAKTERPVKFGTVCGQVLGSMLEVRTEKYNKDKRELIWDMCGAINEQRDGWDETMGLH